MLQKQIKIIRLTHSMSAHKGLQEILQGKSLWYCPPFKWLCHHYTKCLDLYACWHNWNAHLFSNSKQFKNSLKKKTTKSNCNRATYGCLQEYQVQICEKKNKIYIFSITFYSTPSNERHISASGITNLDITIRCQWINIQISTQPVRTWQVYHRALHCLKTDSAQRLTAILADSNSSNRHRQLLYNNVITNY